MSAFFETIKLHDGRLYNLPYHQARFEATVRDVYGIAAAERLETLLAGAGLPERGLYKVRVAYAPSVISMEVEPYAPRRHERVLIRESPGTSYPYKSVDRSVLAVPPGYDDVIFCIDGEVHDTSYCHVALHDGTGWFTPATCLLPGTQRAALIDAGMLIPVRITVSDLGRFTRIAFINAMRDLGQAQAFSIRGREMLIGPLSLPST